MPLEPIPPPFPYGKILTKDIHHCNPLIPCTIHLSDIGKHYHAFSKGTFWIRYIPPAIPQSILHSLAVSPHIDDLQNHSSKTIAMSDLNPWLQVNPWAMWFGPVVVEIWPFQISNTIATVLYLSLAQVEFHSNCMIFGYIWSYKQRYICKYHVWV